MTPWAEVVALGPAADRYTWRCFLCRRSFVFSPVHIYLLLSHLDTQYLLPKGFQAGEASGLGIWGHPQHCPLVGAGEATVVAWPQGTK